MIKKYMAELYKSPHDLNIDPDRSFTIQDTGEHSDTLFSESHGRVS